MTQFKLMSDLHLEFYRKDRYGLAKQAEYMPEPIPYDKDTVLLLAGDIHVGTEAAPWLKVMCRRFKAVVYILGNHEFYGQEMKDVRYRWAKKKIADNFYFLDDDVAYIDDVRILGATMWTKITDPHLRWQAHLRMTDYNVIRFKNPNGEITKLHVGHTDETNKMTMFFLENELQRTWKGKTIVMTHHLPHPLCIAERFKGSDLNAFFMHDCDFLIREYDIDVWCHGHTHDNVDVEVHGTRILCNPRGYHGVQLNQDYIEDLFFDV